MSAIIVDNHNAVYSEVWFTAVRFVNVGGALELHAPERYRLSCEPIVQYRSLPAGQCSRTTFHDPGRANSRGPLRLAIEEGRRDRTSHKW